MFGFLGPPGMRLLLGATAAMLSLIYELGSALLSVASQVQGQEDAQRTGVRCGASACSVQKLASQTASYKVLPGHCSTPVPKQLLSRLSPHIARDKMDVPPPQPQSQAFLTQRRLAKRPHPLPRILQGFTRRWLREGVCWTKVTKPAGQNRDSNREHVGAAKAVQNGVRICIAHPWALAPTPDPRVSRTPHSTRASAPYLAPAIATAAEAAAAASAGDVASSR